MLDQLEELQSTNIGSIGGLKRYIYKFWGDLANARKVLVAPILALCFKLGYTSAQIRERLPFFQKRVMGGSTGDAVRHFCRQWLEISPTQARNLLAFSSLSDFLSQYLYNQ